jgi:hypothetical protein
MGQCLAETTSCVEGDPVAATCSLAEVCLTTLGVSTCNTVVCTAGVTACATSTNYCDGSVCALCAEGQCDEGYKCDTT